MKYGFTFKQRTKGTEELDLTGSVKFLAELNGDADRQIKKKSLTSPRGPRDVDIMEAGSVCIIARGCYPGLFGLRWLWLGVVMACGLPFLVFGAHPFLSAVFCFCWVSSRLRAIRT